MSIPIIQNIINKRSVQVIAFLAVLLSFVIYHIISIITVGQMSSELTSDEWWLQVFGEVTRLLLAIVSIGMIGILFLKKVPLHRIYLFVAIGFGLFYTVLITPLSVPDEDHHYNSTIRLVNIISNPFDDSLMVQSGDFDFHQLNLHQNRAESYLRLQDRLQRQDVDDAIEQPTPYNTDYPIHYIPQMIGILLGRLFHLNFIWSFLLAAFLNLLLFVGCVSLAIKKIPIHKELVFLIGLLPMTLQQASSFSTDSFINGLSILSVACIISSIYGSGKLSRSEILFLTVPLALLGPSKILYVVLALLILLIPNERFSTKRSPLLFKIVLIAASVIPTIILGITRILSLTTLVQTHGTTEGYNYSLSFILNEPIQFIRILLTSFRVSYIDYIRSLIGYFLSGWSMPISLNIVYAFLVLLILLSFAQKDEMQVVDWKFRAITLAISGIVVIGVLTSMLLSFTTKGDPIITGVQGRYFIPILLPLLFIFRNQTVIYHKNINRVLLMIACLLQWRTIDFILFFTMNH